MNEEENKRLGELIIGLANGNIQALNDIYLMMSRILYIVGNMYYSTKEDLEDSIQNLLLALSMKAKKYKSNKNACSWIMKMYRNHFLNFYKKRKRDLEYCSKQAYIKKVNEPTENYYEIYTFFKIILDKLDKHEKELFILKHLYGYSISEIAKELHRPKSTIQSRLENLMEKLLKKI